MTQTFKDHVLIFLCCIRRRSSGEILGGFKKYIVNDRLIISENELMRRYFVFCICLNIEPINEYNFKRIMSMNSIVINSKNGGEKRYSFTLGELKECEVFIEEEENPEYLGITIYELNEDEDEKFDLSVTPIFEE